jgi:hypothetical protein
MGDHKPNPLILVSWSLNFQKEFTYVVARSIGEASSTEFFMKQSLHIKGDFNEAGYSDDVRRTRRQAIL